MREKNIFYNVLRNETSLTEIFCNLLQYKVFRDLFLEMVNEKCKVLGIEEFNLASVKYENFSTEVDLGSNDKEENSKKGRADLVFAYRNEVEYIFELKIETYTNLTDNQPESYLKYLEVDEKDEANKRLFFILPKGYLHKDEIIERWMKVKNHNYSERNIKHQFLYWENILDKIKEKELHKLNPFIHDFYEIMGYRWFYYEDIEFSQKEIELINLAREDKMSKNENVPELMMKLLKIVDETYSKFEINNKNDKQHAEYYGYYLRNSQYEIPENWDIWFGIDYEIWSKEKFPLTIQINSDDPNENEKIKKIKYLKEFTYKKIGKDEEVTTTNYVEFNKNNFNNNEENIIEKFEEKIHMILELTKKIKKVHVN